MDTLELVKILEKPQISHEEAIELAGAINGQSDFATKDDINKLKIDITKVEAELANKATKGDIAKVEAELANKATKGDIAKVEAELANKVNKEDLLKTENRLELHIKNEVGKLEKRITGLEKKVSGLDISMNWVKGLILVVIGLLVKQIFFS